MLDPFISRHIGPIQETLCDHEFKAIVDGLNLRLQCLPDLILMHLGILKQQEQDWHSVFIPHELKWNRIEINTHEKPSLEEDT